MSDIAELYARATDQFGSRVAKIGDDQWGAPTPCTEWDVRALVNHLVYENLWFTPLMQGQTIPEVGDRFEGDLVGEDPAAAWRRASEAALAVAAEPDAFSRTVHLSRGEVPATEYGWEMIMDQTIHGWDLARGIGADDTIDESLVDALWDWLAPNAERLLASGAFAEPIPVPDEADTQTRLLALLGRRQQI